MGKHVELIIDYVVDDGGEFHYYDNTGIIVRCKDCKYSDMFQQTAGDATMPLKCLAGRYGGIKPDGYCDQGKRRTE